MRNLIEERQSLAQLHADGYPVNEADVVRLSPFAHKHIEVHGRYTVALPELPGGRRPLRDPDAPDDEDDE